MYGLVLLRQKSFLITVVFESDLNFSVVISLLCFSVVKSSSLSFIRLNKYFQHLHIWDNGINSNIAGLGFFLVYI